MEVLTSMGLGAGRVRCWMRARSLRVTGRRLSLFLGALLLPACLGDPYAIYYPSNAYSEEEGEPFEAVDRRRYAGSDALQRATEVLVLPNGARMRHGLDRAYYANGQLKFERQYFEDQPLGQWRSWYASGAQESLIEGVGLSEPADSTWWHPNGERSTAGQTNNGTRVGLWTHWYSSGVRMSSGEYIEGRRSGPWMFWYESGEPRAKGEYRDDLRIGAWTLWSEEGESVVRNDPTGGLELPVEH